MDLLSGCLCFRGRQTRNGRLVRSERNKAIECGREKVSVVRVVERGLDFMGGGQGGGQMLDGGVRECLLEVRIFEPRLQ